MNLASERAEDASDLDESAACPCSKQFTSVGHSPQRGVNAPANYTIHNTPASHSYSPADPEFREGSLAVFPQFLQCSDTVGCVI